MDSAGWDVVVIGAGPGGGAAALHCARLGLRTLVIEDHGEIGTPVHCGECLSALAVENLELDLPEEVIALRVDGIRILFPDGTKRQLTEPGYVLQKHLFEQWLVDCAVEEGARLNLSHRLTSMERVLDDDDRFSHWNLAGTGDGFPLTTRLVIDASGVAAVGSRLTGSTEQVEVIAGFQYEMTDVANDGYLDFYIWPEYAPHGYVWMIPKEEGRANVGLVTTEKKGAVKFLNSFIEHTYLKENPKVNPPWREGGRKVRPFGGTIPISGPRTSTVEDGLILIGDAAGFTSPLFEGGSHLALKSGGYAAQVAAKALAAGDARRGSLLEYERLWKAEFPPYHKILRGKKALYALSDDELSAMARCLPDEMNGMSPLSKLMVGLRLLRHSPRLLGKRVISVLLSFGYSRAKHYGW